ncbi:MAG: hydrogenase maturation nickel metallochaperone HypA [Clostridiales Family XIII bacterium]|jgi:hydrogenase nickel incorporation protein HypA/HybF|nr:hydrogenase maturation nickel metallochaperone HypA [Clostridiales Family XIII bacterium]
MDGQMHELGIVLEMVKTVESFLEERGKDGTEMATTAAAASAAATATATATVEALVLEVGELSGIVPAYIEACYPDAVRGTALEGAALSIVGIPAQARCNACTKTFPAKPHRGVCPVCGSMDAVLTAGREMHIREIVLSE